MSISKTLESLLHCLRENFPRDRGTSEIPAFLLLEEFKNKTPADQILTVSMDKPDPERLIDLILCKLSKHGTNFGFKFDDWVAIFEFFRLNLLAGEKRDLLYHGLQLIFIVSRLDASNVSDQYFENIPIEVTDECKSEFENRWLARNIIGCIESFSRLQLDQAVDLEKTLEDGIRHFLDHPFVVDRLHNRLKPCISQPFTVNDLKGLLSRMEIVSINDYIGSGTTSFFRGWVIFNGICLSLPTLPRDDTVRLVDACALCLHESCHYLARKLTNDYLFNSPNFINKKPSNFDPEIPLKALELGRAVELDVFGAQADWASMQHVSNYQLVAETIIDRINDLNWQQKFIDLDTLRTIIKRKPSVSCGPVDIVIFPDITFIE